METKSFKIIQVKYTRKFNFKTFPNKDLIFNLVKNFEAHDACENRGAASSSPFGLSIIQEEYARVINNFAHHIQLSLQQNGRHLDHVL